MQEHPEYGRPLLTFALEYLLANKWPGNSLMHDFNSCDESCEVGMSCGCTCNVDPFEMDDDEVKGDNESNCCLVFVFSGEGKYYILSARLHCQRVKCVKYGMLCLDIERQYIRCLTPCVF